MDINMKTSILDEIDFYEHKLKEAKQKLFEETRSKEKAPVKVLNQAITDSYALYNGDCIDVIKGLPNESIHYSIFSPPFSSLFTYSASLRDLGNSTDTQFYDHFRFLVQDLLRITIPGRLLSFHCSDIPAMKERDGYIGLKDFPGILLRIFEDYGWIYHSRVLIRKDALLEAVRTKALGLAHKQIVKDSSMCRNSLPDYIITVRKPGVNPYPIEHKNGFEEYIGTSTLPQKSKSEDQSKNRHSQAIWQRYADSVWSDINQSDTLNVKLAREKEDEKHLCPLQLPVIARCLELWSKPGETVLSPFMGVGSEGFQSIQMGRKFIGIELKKSYYNTACRYLKTAQKTNNAGLRIDAK